MDASRWLPYRRPVPNARLRLFCFPFAGGGASAFRGWSDDLPAGVELCAVQPPGRENRMAEPAFTRLDALVEALAADLPALLDKPFAFFGHSMGGRVAFELSRLTRERLGKLPLHFFASACRAPQIPNADNRSHSLPDAGFVEALRRLEGVPAAVLDNAELREIFLPILRADFTVFETATYSPGDPLDCPISAFGGLEDPKIDHELLSGWREQTTRSFEARMLPGGHFYLQSQRPALLQAMSRILAPIVSHLETERP